MTASTSDGSRKLELDLSEEAMESLNEIDLRDLDKLILYLPLPSIGRTNMHIDICSDYIDASWAAERLAAASSTATVTEDYVREWHQSRLILTLGKPSSEIRNVLEDSIRLFRGSDEENQKRYQEIRDAVFAYELEIDDYPARLPEIIDDYFANLVNGAYHQLRADDPDYYYEQIAKYPERQLGYYRSALSSRLEASCYTSPDGWVVPASISLDRFFEATGQKYRSSGLVVGTIFMVAGASYVRTADFISHFPMRHYFRSRICASFAQREDEDVWQWDPFDWREASFTYSPYDAWLSSSSSRTVQAGQPEHASCLVHESGSLVIVNDGRFQHLLYDTEQLNDVALKKVQDEISGLMLSIASGPSPAISCNWSSVSDEDFEELCYDIIYHHPKFDSDTIRKLGKSRSRDGGRDIEVYDLPVGRGTAPRKWIFQCKLVKDGSSLSARRLQDVGDMLEMYRAEGFGVMTSAVIDATLYDKLDAVCGNRKVAQLHFSRLELERALDRLPKIRAQYFS
ncbi:hypothetical protein CT676_27715 [Bradyrhizobium sp. MOS001]|uniref:hypothetical protein n=1 Tax=Bradyrhizobium sp. MOS001 TaxID=2133948 RepID=UPI0010750174|nr:hypothetical protein [Bradyrhizobium sp. MOS001]TFW57794.1 hypothetical protein CT676_27715 [Bradyrhizobium sp. MOS001]